MGSTLLSALFKHMKGLDTNNCPLPPAPAPASGVCTLESSTQSTHSQGIYIASPCCEEGGGRNLCVSQPQRFNTAAPFPLQQTLDLIETYLTTSASPSPSSCSLTPLMISLPGLLRRMGPPHRTPYQACSGGRVPPPTNLFLFSWVLLTGCEAVVF